MTFPNPDTPLRVLAAGDRFIRPGLFAQEVRQRLGLEASISELEFAWPDEPFRTIGEVTEAAGDEDELMRALDGQDAIVTQLAPLTRRVLEGSPSLKFIGVSRGGPSNVNLDAAGDLGIQVANVPGRNGTATAEMTLGLILAVMRRIPLAQSSLQAGLWRGDLYRDTEVGLEVAGSTFGLIGAGAVGGHVARILCAMGAKVLVFDPYAPADSLPEGTERVVRVEDIFENSDVITVHARLTPETQGIVSRDHLALMQPGAYIVNSARGPLVDYDALADAIEAGRLAGAALDVYPSEPADFGHRIFSLANSGANIVLTPHIAGASRQTAVRAAAGAAEELRRWASGEPLLNPLSAAPAPLGVNS